MGNSSEKDRKNNEKSLKTRPDDSTQKNRFCTETNLEQNLKEMSMEKFLKNRTIANDKNLININKIDWCKMELWVKCEICGERYDGRYPKQTTDCGHGSRHSFCKKCVVKLEFSESGYQCPICYGS
jgi:hypothetical protein